MPLDHPADKAWQLAQINVGRLVAPSTDPRVKPFFDALERVNALADASPGFIWRLQLKRATRRTSSRPPIPCFSSTCRYGRTRTRSSTSCIEAPTRPRWRAAGNISNALKAPTRPCGGCPQATAPAWTKVSLDCGDSIATARRPWHSPSKHDFRLPDYPARRSTCNPTPGASAEPRLIQ
jgi:hypothetical protein